MLRHCDLFFDRIWRANVVLYWLFPYQQGRSVIFTISHNNSPSSPSAYDTTSERFLFFLVHKRPEQAIQFFCWFSPINKRHQQVACRSFRQQLIVQTQSIALQGMQWNTWTKLFAKVLGLQSHRGLWPVTRRSLCSGDFGMKLSTASQWFLGAKNVGARELRLCAIVGIKPDYESRGVEQYDFNKDV